MSIAPIICAWGPKPDQVAVITPVSPPVAARAQKMTKACQALRRSNHRGMWSLWQLQWLKETNCSRYSWTSLNAGEFVMHANASRRTARYWLKFWLIFSVIYAAGTLGLGWLTGHPFKPLQWVLLTACILVGHGTARTMPRLIRRLTHR